MTPLIRILAIVPALMLLGIWLQWLFMPAEAAKSLGMPLLSVPEASTQIGDLGAFFLQTGQIPASWAISICCCRSGSTNNTCVGGLPSRLKHSSLDLRFLIADPGSAWAAPGA